MTTAKSSTAPARKPRTAKAPADRKAPAVRPENTPGYKLMKKFADIPLWEQEALFNLYDDLRDIEARSEGLSDEDARRLYISTMMQVAKELRNYAIEPEAYDVFLSGADALSRAGELSTTWLGQLGKS